MMRAISAALTCCTSPIWRNPWLKSTTPTASRMSASRRIPISLAMLQVLVANEFDAQFAQQHLDARADQRVKLMFKLIQRGMRVKLGIAGRQERQQPADIIL